MCHIIRILFILITITFAGGTSVLAEESIKDNNNGMIVRISEIEVYPEYLDEYLKNKKENLI